MSNIDKLVEALIRDLSAPGVMIGVILTLGGYIVVLAVLTSYKKVWDEGSRGANGNWDLPEQLMTLTKYYFPFILIAACFLPGIVKVPELIMYYMLGVTFFALTGRWGLEWLERIKGSVTSIFTKKSSTVITEQQQQVDTTKEDGTTNTEKPKVDSSAPGSGAP